MTSNIQWEKNIGRRLQLRDLQVFATVAERLSMAKAAIELGVTQPSVSAVIAGLENSLGARLFDRSPRGVELTAMGQALLMRSRAAFDELRQGIRDIEFLREPDVGEVRIGCPESIAAGFLPAVIDLLSERHPRISLVVVSLATPTLEFRELDERKLDFVLTLLAAPDLNRLARDYAVEVLFEDRLRLVVGSRNPLAGKRKLQIGELSQYPWVIGPAGSPGHSWVIELFRTAGAEFPKRCITTYSVHLRYTMAATGRFIATLPESAFGYTAERSELTMLPVTFLAPPWLFAAVTLRNRNLSPVVSRFLGCARTVAKIRVNAKRRK